METLFTVLHVVAAVFIVGPMAILPMTALRALRAGHTDQVAVLAKSTRVFTLLSLVVAVLGFGVLGMSSRSDDLSFSTPWILASVVLYAGALAVSLVVVVPALQAAAGGAAGSTYGRVAGGSGIVALLLVAVTVLMVWQP
ncbi:hypothetical protein AS850_06780 [Frondihabitans sp. 762G35]|uniref:DUF2269 family protein n=1 Tax=Frondihabitans sp. 762G35 TaxID=1446794 RepID=UPI000D22361C|nr:DUF2269 family protein [Frondihabitans sp. 762G35]ARC56779.1 hypothetical protein AS850_06780 [Frondihabitans sp. 762G35]